MITWLIAFAVSAPLAVLLHEVSHALVAKLCGSTITTFKPWPNRQNGKWWFGYVSWTPIPPERRTKWLYGSPLIISTPMVIGLSIGGLWWPPLFAWSAWEALDFVNWWKGYFEIETPFTQRWSQPITRQDGSRFRRFTK